MLCSWLYRQSALYFQTRHSTPQPYPSDRIQPNAPFGLAQLHAQTTKTSRPRACRSQIACNRIGQDHQTTPWHGQFMIWWQNPDPISRTQICTIAGFGRDHQDHQGIAAPVSLPVLFTLLLLLLVKLADTFTAALGQVCFLSLA